MYSLWRGDELLGDITQRLPGKYPGVAIAGTVLPTAALQRVGPMMQMTYPGLPPVQHPLKPFPIAEALKRETAGGPDWLATAPSQEEAIDVEDDVNVPPHRLLEIRSGDGTAIATEMIGLACLIVPASADVHEIRRRWGTDPTGGRLWTVTVKFAEF